MTLKSSQHHVEMRWEERSENWDIPNARNFCFDFDFCSWILLWLWCAGVALAQAISAISSLCALHAGLDGSEAK
ncbi:hypothetical protein [Bradyrhizobium liaoningense]